MYVATAEELTAALAEVSPGFAAFVSSRDDASGEAESAEEAPKGKTGGKA